MRNPTRNILLGAAMCLFSLSALATGVLENPQTGSTQTGIGLISGWNCSASQITIRIDGGSPTPVAYGTPRADTGTVCGRTNTGFGLLYNFNLLGAGNHTIVALADGVQFQSSTFKVVTLGQEFLRGAAATTQVIGFPDSTRQATLQWQESKQNFSITGSGPITTNGSLGGTYRLVRTTVDFLGGQIYDTTLGNIVASGTMVIADNHISQSFTVTVMGQTMSGSISGTFSDFGAYLRVDQTAGAPRIVVVIRNPTLVLETIAQPSGLGPFTEVDQWALISSSLFFDDSRDSSISPDIPSMPVGGVIARLLQGPSSSD